MAILDDAAQLLVTRLTSLDEDVAEAQERLAAHHEALRALDEQMASDWNSLTVELTSFLEKVQEETGLLNQDGNAAVRALSELQGEIQGARSEAEAELVGSRDDVKTLADHVRALEAPLDNLVATGAEAPFASLRDLAQEVERQMEEALLEAREFMQQVSTDLESLRADVVQRAEEVRSHLTGVCVDNLQNAYDQWQEHLEELEQLVEEKFNELPENAREVVEYAMTECTTGHEEEFDRLGELVNDIEQSLQDLDGTVDETETDIGEEGFGAVDERLSSASLAVGRTVEALDRVKDALARYSFL